MRVCPINLDWMMKSGQKSLCCVTLCKVARGVHDYRQYSTVSICEINSDVNGKEAQLGTRLTRFFTLYGPHIGRKEAQQHKKGLVRRNSCGVIGRCYILLHRNLGSMVQTVDCINPEHDEESQALLHHSPCSVQLRSLH